MNTPNTEPTLTGAASKPCALCGQRAGVHWQKRLTDEQLDEQIALEQARRDDRTALADPDGPPPTFPPLPTATDYTRIVHGCDQHGITLSLAALIHTKACTAPAVGDLPGCDCTPEAAPPGEPAPESPPLPDGWVGAGGV